MFCEGISTSVPSTAKPVFSILTSAGGNDFPYIGDVFASSFFEVDLCFADVGFAGDFAAEFVDDHTSSTFAGEPAAAVGMFQSYVAVALAVAEVEIDDALHHFVVQIRVEFFSEVGEFVVGHLVA